MKILLQNIYYLWPRFNLFINNQTAFRYSCSNNPFGADYVNAFPFIKHPSTNKYQKYVQKHIKKASFTRSKWCTSSYSIIHCTDSQCINTRIEILAQVERNCETMQLIHNDRLSPYAAPCTNIIYKVKREETNSLDIMQYWSYDKLYFISTWQAWLGPRHDPCQEACN